jgi:hypothetical protein
MFDDQVGLVHGHDSISVAVDHLDMHVEPAAP